MKHKRNSFFKVIGKTTLAVILIMSLSFAGVGTAFADDGPPVVPYWDAPREAVTVDPDLLTTYGVRAGSAGPDFLGISNTNFDFTGGSATSPDQYPVPAGDLDTVAVGSGLAIWATPFNEAPNPYYVNLYYNAIASGSATQATTWMSNPVGSWGDSNGTASTNFYSGASTIAGLEYDPDIIFGANKITAWQNALADGSNSETVIIDYFDNNPGTNYHPVWTSNDATNIWGQIYTIEQLAGVAEDLKDGTDKETRYDNNNATTSAVNYEKVIRGNLLYLASMIDTEQLEEKTVAYLYSIDNDDIGYFFTPVATDMLVGNDTGKAPTSALDPDPNYAANNATIDFGYMATLPFITNTYDSGVPFSFGGIDGIIMEVEEIWKASPACVVDGSDLEALADVDVIIYNTTKLRGNELIGVQNGRNDSGIDINDDYCPDCVEDWAEALGFTGTYIAGDDFFTSPNQDYGNIDTTPAGMSPLLYCQRNYTDDKNARAAWAFGQVYPEAYVDENLDENPDATYAYWVDKIYHINLADVPEVATYMTNKSVPVVYTQDTIDDLEANFAAGRLWWKTTGSSDPYWSQFAYYNGSTRASYFSNDHDSEEPEDTIGIFAPSSLWSK